MSEREAIYVPGLSRHLVVMSKVITSTPLEFSLFPSAPPPSLLRPVSSTTILRPSRGDVRVLFCDLMKGSRGIEFIRPPLSTPDILLTSLAGVRVQGPAVPIWERRPLSVPQLACQMSS